MAWSKTSLCDHRWLISKLSSVNRCVKSKLWWRNIFPVVSQMEQQGPAYLTTGQFAPHALGRRDRPDAVQNARHQAYDMRMQSSREQHNKVRRPTWEWPHMNDSMRNYNRHDPQWFWWLLVLFTFPLWGSPMFYQNPGRSLLISSGGNRHNDRCRSNRFVRLSVCEAQQGFRDGVDFVASRFQWWVLWAKSVGFFFPCYSKAEQESSSFSSHQPLCSHHPLLSAGLYWSVYISHYSVPSSERVTVCEVGRCSEF